MTGILKGKVTFITAAGGAMGLATAEAVAEAGASVAVADREEEKIGKTAMLRCIVFAALLALLPSLGRAGPKEDAEAVFGRFLASFTAADPAVIVDQFWPDALFWGTTMTGACKTVGFITMSLQLSARRSWDKSRNRVCGRYSRACRPGRYRNQPHSFACSPPRHRHTPEICLL
jgi:NAD(P)-dependent dehydrogenase (short-subunit alcohol dehydrogenase family)